jgi:hypothetical protein
MKPSTTWSPGLRPSTPGPVSTTVPAPSCPPTMGNPHGMSPVTTCIRLAQAAGTHLDEYLTTFRWIEIDLFDTPRFAAVPQDGRLCLHVHPSSKVRLQCRRETASHAVAATECSVSGHFATRARSPARRPVDGAPHRRYPVGRPAKVLVEIQLRSGTSHRWNTFWSGPGLIAVTSRSLRRSSRWSTRVTLRLMCRCGTESSRSLRARQRRLRQLPQPDRCATDPGERARNGKLVATTEFAATTQQATTGWGGPATVSAGSATR